MMTDLPTPTTETPATAGPSPLVTAPISDPEVLEVDMNPVLTLGQLEDLEVALGYPMSEANDPGRSPMRLVRAMLYVRRKKLDPSYTFDQTYDLPPQVLVTFSDALSAMQDADQGPPAMP